MGLEKKQGTHPKALEEDLLAEDRVECMPFDRVVHCRESLICCPPG